MLGDVALRRRSREAGLRIAADCRWEVVADRYVDIYRRVSRADETVVRRDRGVEVVVVAYGTPERLRLALAPLDGLPVTVVDNSASAQVRRVCSDLGVRYLDAGRNRGFGGGVNLALDDRLDPTADVLLVNPDAVVGADDVTALHRALLADPTLASVGPAQVDETGTPTRVGWPFPSPSRTWAEAVGLGRVVGDRADFAIGSVLLLRSEALAQVGGFDEGFFLYAEETDWAYRAARLGWHHARGPLGDRDPRGRGVEQRPGTARSPLPRIAGALPAQALRRRRVAGGPGRAAGRVGRAVRPPGRSWRRRPRPAASLPARTGRGRTRIPERSGGRRMTLRARLQGPLLWTVSVVTLLALMFGVARLVPEQPYLALLVAVVVLMLGLTLADPTVIPLLAMPVLLVVVRVSAGGIALSVSDVVLFVAFWPAVVLGGRPYSPPMRSLLWLTAVYQACTLFTVVANPFTANAVEWFHAWFLTGGALIIGWALGRAGRGAAALTLLLLASCVIAVATIAQGVAHLPALDPVYPELPFSMHKNFAGTVLCFAALVAYVHPPWMGGRGGWPSAPSCSVPAACSSPSRGRPSSRSRSRSPSSCSRTDETRRRSSCSSSPARAVSPSWPRWSVTRSTRATSSTRCSSGSTGCRTPSISG